MMCNHHKRAIEDIMVAFASIPRGRAKQKGVSEMQFISSSKFATRNAVEIMLGWGVN